MIVYNANDHGVEVKLTIPDNTGFELRDLIDKILDLEFVYGSYTTIPMGDERIKEPIVEVKLA